MGVDKENQTEKNQDKVEESAEAFKTIRVFNSLEEENEYTYRSYARLSPEKRLAAVTRMRVAAHPYLDKNPMPWGKKVYIDSK